MVSAMSKIPGYWMDETSGVLRPAVEAYLHSERMTGEQIAAMRAYLRQWIMSPYYAGPTIDVLRASVGTLTTRAAISRWARPRRRPEHRSPLAPPGTHRERPIRFRFPESAIASDPPRPPQDGPPPWPRPI